MLQRVRTLYLNSTAATFILMKECASPLIWFKLRDDRKGDSAIAFDMQTFDRLLLTGDTLDSL